MNKNKTQAKWNASQAKLPDNKEHSHYAEDQIKILKPNSIICDLGGSIGADAIFFAGKGHDVYLYDISEKALERARQRAKNQNLDISTVQADFGDENFSLPKGRFDLVFSRLAIHYFRTDILIRILNIIYDSLKIGGIAKITMKSPLDEAEMKFLKSNAEEIEPGVFEENGFIKTRFSLDQLEQILGSTNIPKENYSVKTMQENFEDKVDQTKSGNTIFVLNEITIVKR